MKIQAVILNGSEHVSIYHLVWDPITISSLRMLLRIGLYVGITKDKHRHSQALWSLPSGNLNSNYGDMIKLLWTSENSNSLQLNTTLSLQTGKCYIKTEKVKWIRSGASEKAPGNQRDLSLIPGRMRIGRRESNIQENCMV